MGSLSSRWGEERRLLRPICSSKFYRYTYHRPLPPPSSHHARATVTPLAKRSFQRGHTTRVTSVKWEVARELRQSGIRSATYHVWWYSDPVQFVFQQSLSHQLQKQHYKSKDKSIQTAWFAVGILKYSNATARVKQAWFSPLSWSDTYRLSGLRLLGVHVKTDIQNIYIERGRDSCFKRD